MSFTLTADSPESKEFEIKGSCEVLLVGNTPCKITRSIFGSEFYPMTDSEGVELVYEGGNSSDVIYNGTLHNNTPRTCKFKIVLDEPILPDSKVNITLSQGW